MGNYSLKFFDKADQLKGEKKGLRLLTRTIILRLQTIALVSLTQTLNLHQPPVSIIKSLIPQCKLTHSTSS